MKRDRENERLAVARTLWAAAGIAGGFLLFAAAVVLAAVLARD